MSGVLMQLSNGLAEAVAQASPAVIGVLGRQGGHASGVLWRDGVVVTANHAVRQDEEITLLLPNERTVTGQLAGRDPGSDVAVLTFSDGAGQQATTTSSDLTVGNLVLALARHPRHGVCASSGLISAVGKPWRTWHGGEIDRLIRLDLTLYPGFSGGPLIDMQGRVLGLNTYGPRRMAMTLPASTIGRVVEQLLKKGRVARGYLGVGLQRVQLPQALLNRGGLKQNSALLVLTVSPGSPAERAGITLGDVLLTLDGQDVTDPMDVHARLDAERIGKPVHARILRGGAPIELDIVIGDRPETEE